MICRYCGYESEKDFRFCPDCGKAPQTAETGTEQQNFNSQQTPYNYTAPGYGQAQYPYNTQQQGNYAPPQQTPYTQQGAYYQQVNPYGTPYYQQPKKKTNGLAIAGFVCSLAGINLIGLILSIFGYKQEKASDEVNETMKGLAIAGIIIGALRLVVTIAILIIYFGMAMQIISDPSFAESFEDGFAEGFGEAFNFLKITLMNIIG